MGQHPLAVTYQALLIRWQSNNSLLWQLFAFLIAAQVALATAYAQVPDGTFLKFAIGCVGLGGFGLFGPLAIRFIEMILLIDRLLLDRYEQELIPDSHTQLRLLHSHRMRARLSTVIDLQALDAPHVATLSKRRLTQLGRTGAHIDHVLDIFGQPSLIFTMVVAGAGCFGFDLGLTAWSFTQHLEVGWQATIIVVVNVILLAIAIFSGFGKQGRATARVDRYWNWFIDTNKEDGSIRRGEQHPATGSAMPLRDDTP